MAPKDHDPGAWEGAGAQGTAQTREPRAIHRSEKRISDVVGEGWRSGISLLPARREREVVARGEIRALIDPLSSQEEGYHFIYSAHGLIAAQTRYIPNTSTYFFLPHYRPSIVKRNFIFN
jgi:hypothetical protein